MQSSRFLRKPSVKNLNDFYLYHDEVRRFSLHTFCFVSAPVDSYSGALGYFVFCYFYHVNAL